MQLAWSLVGEGGSVKWERLNDLGADAQWPTQGGGGCQSVRWEEGALSGGALERSTAG